MARGAVMVWDAGMVRALALPEELQGAVSPLRCRGNGA